jgi:hypothetical protein
MMCIHEREGIMEVSVIALPTVRGLTDFVRETLCHHDRLDPQQTPFYRSPITRNNKTTGMLFHVEGPRLLKTSALWTIDEHRLLFYDSVGIKFFEVRLSESPDVKQF